VDPRLVRFSADLEWLKAQGATVTRFNLAQQALAFTGDDEVKAALQAKGEGALPLVKVDGKVQSVGGYPTRDQLAAWAGLGAPERFLDEDKKSRSAEAEPESKPSAGCCGGTGATPDCCG